MLFAKLRQAWRRLVDLWEAALSKGQKKPSLRDLSNVLHLNDYIQDVLHELENQSDRGAALIAAAAVDISLKLALRCRMVAFKEFEHIMFDRDGAPLATFSDRIKIARAFGVIGPDMERHLNAIRNVRNQFAHSPLKIDFTNPLIMAEIEKLLPDNPAWRPDWSEGRRRYIGTATLMGEALERLSQEHLQDHVPVWSN